MHLISTVDIEIENGIFILYKEITSCCTYKDFLNAVFHIYQKLFVIFHLVQPIVPLVNFTQKEINLIFMCEIHLNFS